MLKVILLVFCATGAFGYFTLPGKCPENVPVMEHFSIPDFHGKWYQAYYYASDGQKKNNCSTLEISFKSNSDNYPVLSFNQSRIDRGLFHRYSIANVPPPAHGSQSGDLELVFNYQNAPRRLKTRKYQFRVLATNYNYYATAFTCQYSPLIDKHFIYVWILSRNPILNDVSKELAMRPLQQIGLLSEKLIRDDQSKCSPKYYDDFPTEPTTFKYPVPI
ncbi:unnamed protein product [Diatraea saccharalis]|uniref:Lipocalin/cytosolic fatty-acid binding domain-containing protein n=1 Tax=Diatraea saccharalis TaxID=40085 RepID=A0A9N9WG48_9NEOP|nr:unnamed protein product [Diatraea saccharalis]